MHQTKKKILFVTSNTQERRRCIEGLSPTLKGWDLSFNSTASEALISCLTEEFHMIISDYALTDGNGPQLLESIKYNAPETIRFLLIPETEVHQFKGPLSSAQQMLASPVDYKKLARKIKYALELRSAVASPNVLKFIGNAESLPALPKIFDRLTQELNNPKASLAHIGEIISGDIVLSSKVLKMANSALFNLQSPAKDISHAVSLLGINTVTSLVFSEGICTQFSVAPSLGQFAEKLNQHCLVTGALASIILKRWKATPKEAEQAVFCGIVHDIGKLILAQFAPDEWSEVAKRSAEGSLPDIQVEREILGVGHSEVAAYLLSIWGFPDEIVAPVAFHHEPIRFHNQQSQLLCALHLADNCCCTDVHGVEFDWEFLKARKITPKQTEKFSKLINL